MGNCKNRIVILFAVVLMILTSCDDTGDNQIDSNNSVYDFTEGNADLSILNAALIRTSLDFTLDNQGEYTLFAPNNTAFNEYFTANGYAGVDAVPITELRALLFYHILTTEVFTNSMNNGYVKTLGKDEEIEFLDLYINAATPILLNGGSRIIEEDFVVSNGVVHIIDTVVELPTINSLITANPEYSNLNSALVQTGLFTTLSSVDNTMNAPFTVFAPVDDAFQALVDLDPNDNLNSTADILNLTNLTDILLYHVIGSQRLRNDDFIDGLLLDPIAAGTEELLINTTDGTVITDGQMQSINVTNTNITAVNGVIHSLDLVMRPL
jgi:uncharacterized surface protein with fasciclin (FAS1) repeats